MALAAAGTPCDPPRMGADDEVSADDLLAGVRTVAEYNAMIRAGLAAAGECGEPADECGGGNRDPA